MKKLNYILFIIIICFYSCNEQENKGYRLLEYHEEYDGREGEIRDYAEIYFPNLGVRTYYAPNSINGPVTYICKDESLNGKIRVRTYPYFLESYNQNPKKYKDFNSAISINNDTIKLGEAFIGYMVAEDFRDAKLGREYDINKVYYKQFKEESDTWFTEDSFIFSKIKFSIKNRKKYKLLKLEKFFNFLTLFRFQHIPKQTGVYTFEGYYDWLIYLKDGSKRENPHTKFKYKYVVIE